jgi:ATP-dependent RNA helicase DeaD
LESASREPNQEFPLNKFSDLNLPPALNQALVDMGYETPTPVQQKAIPLVLAMRDLLVTAQTGTGKTAAFAIPLLKEMINADAKLDSQAAWDAAQEAPVRPVLILSPTRELAEQIGQVLLDLTTYTPEIGSCVIIGGSSYYKQISDLKNKPMFVVGTPGRLIDLMDQRRYAGLLDLSSFGTLVLDEADRLLDMGFAPQIHQIVSEMPKERQTLLFSATLAPEVQSLASRYMKNPERISIGLSTKPIAAIKQDLIKTSASQKNQTLIREIDKIAGSIIIFTRTQTRTEQVAKLLTEAGHQVGRIHGGRTQQQRSSAIDNLRNDKIRILVATDIAARGIDVPHIRHVINFDLPMAPEDYIHRIGRTGRAGMEGHSISFVTPEESDKWGKIYKLMHGKFPEGFEKRGHPADVRAAKRGGRPTAPSQTGGKFGARGGGQRQGESGYPKQEKQNWWDEKKRPRNRKSVGGPPTQKYLQKSAKPAAGASKAKPYGAGGSAQSPAAPRAERRAAGLGKPDEFQRRKGAPGFARGTHPGSAGGPKKSGQSSSRRPTFGPR